MMRAYKQIHELHDWDDEDVLVEITPESLAHVREITEQTIPATPIATDEALSVAHRLVSSGMYRQIVIRLQDGASWDASLGTLS